MTFDNWWEENKDKILQQIANRSILFMEIGAREWFKEAWTGGWNLCKEILEKYDRENHKKHLTIHQWGSKP